MTKDKSNIDLTNEPSEEVSYTLRGLPRFVHDEMASYQLELGYKKGRKFSLEQSYVEALVDWVNKRKESLKAAI